MAICTDKTSVRPGEPLFVYATDHDTSMLVTLALTVLESGKVHLEQRGDRRAIPKTYHDPLRDRVTGLMVHQVAEEKYLYSASNTLTINKWKVGADGMLEFPDTVDLRSGSKGHLNSIAQQIDNGTLYAKVSIFLGAEGAIHMGLGEMYEGHVWRLNGDYVQTVDHIQARHLRSPFVQALVAYQAAEGFRLVSTGGDKMVRGSKGSQKLTKKTGELNSLSKPLQTWQVKVWRLSDETCDDGDEAEEGSGGIPTQSTEACTERESVMEDDEDSTASSQSEEKVRRGQVIFQVLYLLGSHLMPVTAYLQRPKKRARRAVKQPRGRANPRQPPTLKDAGCKRKIEVLYSKTMRR